MDFKFYPIVELFWKDHYDLGDEWYDKIPDDGVRIISTVGYLVGEDDDYYYVSCNYDFGIEHYSSGSAVLKDCVVQRRVLSKGVFDYDQFARKRTFGQNSKPKPPPSET